MKFNKREFRSSVRRVLLTAHGETVKTCTREQLANAVNQCVETQWPLYQKQGDIFDEMGQCVKDMFKGK